jgi:hypothetical protein
MKLRLGEAVSARRMVRALVSMTHSITSFPASVVMAVNQHLSWSVKR